LLNSNPNLNAANGTGAANPFRLDRSQAHTADQNHAYGPEEATFDGGKMDLFPKNTETADSGDGNTVTAFWNYAQHFAMSDNSYSSQFGPSSPGAVNSSTTARFIRSSK
jgi:phospholipase C